MLRYALRRALWAIPTLIATSLIVFGVTALAPDPAPSRGASGNANDPANDPAHAGATPPGGPSVDEARRARFLDLPRFVNADPQDVRSRAREAVAHVAAGDDRQAAAIDSLGVMGGAALPYVLPLLEALPPDARGRVARALAPVALRAGVGNPERLRRPEGAVLFWTRF